MSLSAYSKGTQERTISRRVLGMGGVVGVGVAVGTGMGALVEAG